MENTTEETVELFLEWLYRGDYNIPTSAIDEQEEEAEEEHPVVTSAVAGYVGVWGCNKPAAVGRSYVLEKSSSRGLESKYVAFGEDSQVSVIGGIYLLHTRELGGHAYHRVTEAISERVQLPSALISPKIEHDSLPSPSLMPMTVSIHHDPPPTEAQHKPCASAVTIESILAAHLALYAFSVRYQIMELNQQILFKISAYLESHSPSADSLICFIRGVYCDSEETGNIGGLTRDSPLREFVVRYVAYRLEEVRSHPSFKKLLAQRSEFAVDLVQCIMGGVGTTWVK